MLIICLQQLKRDYQKLSAPVLWEWPRAEIVELVLNIISLSLDALFPTLFQFAYTFKTKAFFIFP